MKNDTNEAHPLKPYFRAWRGAAGSGFPGAPPSGEHISDEEAWALASPGGISQADPSVVEHVSQCALCLSKWSARAKALADARALDEPPEGREADAGPLAFGFLEAAATKASREPLELSSACGRFLLRIFPQMDDPQKALVALETVSEEDTSLEGKRVVVRDNRGKVLLRGTLREGRLARTLQDVAEIDLTTWTLVAVED